MRDVRDEPAFRHPDQSEGAEPRTGGSSSGSASVVAAGLCDFALGTDTGGSVRVPASFCGLYGLRTTFGRLSVAGIMAMAPSFDTVGWLARDARTLRRVGEVYFGPVGRSAQHAFCLHAMRSISRSGRSARRCCPRHDHSVPQTRSRYLSKASISGSTRSGRCSSTICGRRWAPGARLRAGGSARRSRNALNCPRMSIQ